VIGIRNALRPIERWMVEKQGIQQELLPGSATSTQSDLAPVVAQPTNQAGGRGEQMIFGGMQEMLSGACPDCGSQLEFAEGCMKCHVCGFSECG
jgi:ribonucleoside-diphosphate reductase alpha chain